MFSTTIIFNTRVTYNGVEYPDLAIYLGWGFCLSSSLCIPAYAVSYVLLKKVWLKYSILKACFLECLKNLQILNLGMQFHKKNRIFLTLLQVPCKNNWFSKLWFKNALTNISPKNIVFGLFLSNSSPKKKYFHTFLD